MEIPGQRISGLKISILLTKKAVNQKLA
jgi:hypothetical protein